jgi:hypothetical protein
VCVTIFKWKIFWCPYLSVIIKKPGNFKSKTASFSRDMVRPGMSEEGSLALNSLLAKRRDGENRHLLFYNKSNILKF